MPPHYFRWYARGPAYLYGCPRTVHIAAHGTGAALESLPSVVKEARRPPLLRAVALGANLFFQKKHDLGRSAKVARVGLGRCSLAPTMVAMSTLSGNDPERYQKQKKAAAGLARREQAKIEKQSAKMAAAAAEAVAAAGSKRPAETAADKDPAGGRAKRGPVAGGGGGRSGGGACDSDGSRLNAALQAEVIALKAQLAAANEATAAASLAHAAKAAELVRARGRRCCRRLGPSNRSASSSRTKPSARAPTARREATG